MIEGRFGAPAGQGVVVMGGDDVVVVGAVVVVVAAVVVVLAVVVVVVVGALVVDEDVDDDVDELDEVVVDGVSTVSSSCAWANRTTPRTRITRPRPMRAASAQLNGGGPTGA